MKSPSRVATILGLVSSLAPSLSYARTQNSASLQLGAVGLGAEGKLWQSTRADLGLRFESIFLRESPRDLGLGFFVEARTAWFAHGDYGGGFLALLPVDMTFPIWLGGGGFARRGDGAWAPGANAFLAWGGRSYNHHSSYAMAYGLIFDARWHGGATPGTDLVVAASIDLEGIALPFLYLVSAIRH